MAPPPPRLATVVLVDASGRVLGALPPFTAATPWWQDIEPVVRAVEAVHGLRITVLRLLDAERPRAHGGAVSYLAQVAATGEDGDVDGDSHGDAPVTLPPLLQPWPGRLTEQPLRHGYARLGGPQADLAWARRTLRAQGLVPRGRPVQVRSWNLSSLWQLPTETGPVWLKVVPPFFAHEGAVIAALAAAVDVHAGTDADADAGTDADEGPDADAVPRPLGHTGARLLLAHIPGVDGHDASLPQRLAMVDRLVALQARWIGREPELLALGVPDSRAAALGPAIAELVARHADALAADERVLLARFVAGLPARWARLASCRLPDTLVHGDFHAGNVRVDGARLTLIDWADSCIGHPLLDLSAFLDQTPAAQAAGVRAHWHAAWQRAVPGCDPDRAARLLAPVTAARRALIYQGFLDHIEPAEHAYHRLDVPEWLLSTAQALRDERP